MRYLLFLLILCCTYSLYSQSVTIKDGSWNDPSVWESGEVPSKTEDVIIRHKIALKKNLKTTGRITIQEDALLCVSKKLEIVEGQGNLHNQGTLRCTHFIFMKNFINHGLFEAAKVETVWKGFDTTKGKMRIGKTLDCSCSEITN